MYHEKEFVRRDETGNFVFSRLHRTERETEVVQSITGRTRPVGTPHGTALRCLATELYTPPIRNGHRHPRQTGGDGRRLPRVAARIGRPSIGRKHLGKQEKMHIFKRKPTETCTNVQ